MTPAVPPLPTIWNLPFQPSLGIQTSKRTAGVVTPTTRHIGSAIVPIGDALAPVGRSSASVIVVSGMLTAALRSAHAMGCAAAGRAIKSRLRSMAFIVVSLMDSSIVVIVVIVVIAVVVMMIVVVIQFFAQLLGGAVVRIAWQNGARGRLSDQAIGVLLQQEALADLLSGNTCHQAVVALLAAVAFLHRAARIVVRHPRGLGHGERNVAGSQIAFVTFQRSGCDRVPAG